MEKLPTNIFQDQHHIIRCNIYCDILCETSSIEHIIPTRLMISVIPLLYPIINASRFKMIKLFVIIHDQTNLSLFNYTLLFFVTFFSSFEMSFLFSFLAVSGTVDCPAC
jgi:hypothetical protein